MINKLFPNAIIKKTFMPTGISNIIQSVERDEILYIKAKSKEQLDDLVERFLDLNFIGLLVSPFVPSREDLNYCILECQEMDRDIREKIEIFYPLRDPLPPIFGVTGTNGKTSCCWMFSEVMRLKEKKVLYLGTMGTFLSGKKLPDKVITTTPSFLELRKIYDRYKNNVDFICIEVSSHALVQNRLGGLKLEVGAWTNFTQDHLDYHGTMNEYFEAKKKIQDIIIDKKIIVLSEESKIIEKLKENRLICETYIDKIKLPTKDEILGQGFLFKNLKISLCAVKRLGVSLQGLDYDAVRLPPGRFEVIKKHGRIFIIDYAHTPDALEKLLEQTSKSFNKGEVYVVFGCGGNRDKSKRAIMGKAASDSGFKIILTSDNPRNENAEQIIVDISNGIKRDYLSIVDRKAAIEKAYSLSSVGDSIVIAGKGHEDYQEINGIRYPFSDQEVVRLIND